MQIKITKTFKSGKLGICEANSIIDCDNAMGKYIVSSKLGVEVEGVLTTKDIPLPVRRVRRKQKKIGTKQVETTSLEANGER